MTWVVWRQHRSALVLVVAGFLGMALVMVAATMSGVTAAVAYRTEDGLGDLLGDVEKVNNLLTLWHALIGALIGVPMVSREWTRGTFRFSWTQSVSRSYWLRTKLLVVGGVIVVSSAVYALVHAAWFDVTEGESSVGVYEDFNQGVLVLPALCLFGFAFGLAAGAVIKRVIPAMVVTFAATTYVPIFLYFYARPHYAEAAVLRVPDRMNLGTPIPEGAMLVDSAASAPNPPPGAVATYWFQPADRYMFFQFIEAGIYLAMTAVLFAITAWWVRRKFSEIAV